jgi:hypothetical protein
MYAGKEQGGQLFPDSPFSIGFTTDWCLGIGYPGKHLFIKMELWFTRKTLHDLSFYCLDQMGIGHFRANSGLSFFIAQKEFIPGCLKLISGFTATTLFLHKFF